MSSFVSGSEESTKEFKGRFKVLYLAVIIASSIVLARLWYLQIIQGQELRDYSEKNRVKETKIVAPRGFFLDRNGEVLVQNLPGFSVTISPQYTIKLEQTAEEVGKVLNLPKEEIIKTVKESRYRNGPFRPVPIRENLSLDEVFKLKLIRLKHPGLNIQKNIVRNYPLGANGAQIFGYVGEISKNQIQFLNKKYTDIRFEQGDIIGKSGIEEVWEPSVRGVPGITFVEVDAKGREATTDTPSFLGLKAFKAKPGSNLVLTLDKDIQIAAQTAMNRDDKIGPRIGSLVAIKNNGEILAWVNSPSFDPNEFSTGISNELWEKLINDPFKPLRNKVIQDHYAPGSTFKPIIALAALQEKVITPSTIVYSPGFIKFGRRMYHDHTKHGHGNINVIHAIERSSNVFFYKMGISLGIDKMFEYASAFGIGQKTGINLSNEVPGLMPNSEWKKRQYGEEWQPGENLSNAIGQGFVLTTPLQMALAFNAIGTEGKLYKPFIVKKLTNHNDEIIKEFEPQLARDLSIADENGFKIDKENFKTVKEGMRLVSNGERGTARWYKVPGIEMAGKTGTAQVRSFSADQIYEKCNERSIEERHHGWFIAFAPADYPEITVAVLAEHACAGSSGGAPVARDVIRAYFEKYHPEKIKGKKKFYMSTNIKVTERNFFQRLDSNYIFVILALNVIGLINLYSATHSVNVTYNEKLFFQQIVWLFAGWILFFTTTFVDYVFWKRISWVIYILNILLLMAVMFFGKEVYGSQRWLDLGFFRFQPSETVKIAVILMMANYLSAKSAYKGLGYRDLLIPAIITGIPFVLTVKQPDLGTALLMAFISTSMIIFVRVKRSILILAAILTLFATPIAWNFGLKEYQRNRVLTFLSPGRDPRGTGYNSIQSKIAVGSGRILGKGFRKGTQSQLEFIPERHSDFIFSVLSEEHGFIGSVTTISLFIILYIMSINIAVGARDKFGTLIVVGVTSSMFWHMFINIGMVIGILPIVGVPLPLLSYGGSSLLTTMFGLGLISAVAFRKYLF